MQSAFLVPAFVLCVVMGLVIAGSPALAAVDPPSTSARRVHSLDGLRGFLALAVLFHHGVIYRPYLQTGAWDVVPGFGAMLGQGGVAMFFILTGYLFWRRLIARRGRPNWMMLYVGRLFRIGPLYLTATGAALLISFLAAPTLNVPWGMLARQLGRYALLGGIPLQSVNGFETPLLLAKVTWSLQYEWAFYLALPVLALLARSPRLHVGGAAVGLLATMGLLCWLPAASGLRMPTIGAALFSIGMLTASLQAHGFGRRGFGKWADLTATLLIAGSLAGFDTAYDVVPLLLLGGAFLLLASGCTLFGALTCRPALRLGEISYGVYLLQGLALAACLQPAPLRALALASPLGHWALVFLATALLIPLATATHVLVERRGTRLGQSVANSVVAWLASHRPLVSLPPAPLSPEALEPR